MKKSIFGALLLFGTAAFGQQQDTVIIPNDGTAGTINQFIQGDTTSTGEPAHPNRVYRILRGGLYVLKGPIVVRPGAHVELLGGTATQPDPGPATIIEGTVTGEEYQFNFDCFGDLTLKHVRLMYITDGGIQYWTSIQFERDSLRGDFDDVIFEWDRGPCVMVAGKHFTGTFNNCIFRNDIDPSQWWAGRQITFLSYASCDSIGCANNTFENMGFVFQSDYSPPRRAWYNHNTFLNIAKCSFKQQYFTSLVCINNIFVNSHFAGEREVENLDEDNLLWGATINLDTLLSGIDYGDVIESRRVCVFTNNSNYSEASFKNLFDDMNAPVSEPQLIIHSEPIMNTRTLEMFTWHPFYKMADVYDSTDPHFVVPATQTDSMTVFLRERYGPGGNVFWGYEPGEPTAPQWPLPENLAYTNEKLLAGGIGSYPLGDLYHWFPASYRDWCAQRVKEENEIWEFYLNGVGPSPKAPTGFMLGQNFPNPFNPSTVIRFKILSPGYVSLRVYDILGRMVTTLFSGHKDPGEYQVAFDGGAYAGGVYFYRFQAGCINITRKMVLLK